MEYTIAMGVWAVTIAAPCVASWLAGDFNGAARTRRALETGSAAPVAAAGPLATYTRPSEPDLFEPAPLASVERPAAAAAPRTVEPVAPAAPLEDAPSEEAPPEETTPSIEEQVRQAEARHRARRALMPGGAQSGGSKPGEPDAAAAGHVCRTGRPDAEDRAMRMTALAKDPAVERVLRHYERSIRTLEQAEAQRDAQTWVVTDHEAEARDSAAMLTQMPQWTAPIRRTS